jgi:hypothetical protein
MESVLSRSPLKESQGRRARDRAQQHPRGQEELHGLVLRCGLGGNNQEAVQIARRQSRLLGGDKQEAVQVARIPMCRKLMLFDTTLILTPLYIFQLYN